MPNIKKFKEVLPGQQFTPIRHQSITRLWKIEPIEDKWGNLFVAADKLGKLIDSEVLKPEDEVLQTREEVTWDERLRDPQKYERFDVKEKRYLPQSFLIFAAKEGLRNELEKILPGTTVQSWGYNQIRVGFPNGRVAFLLYTREDHHCGHPLAPEE
jgi:hypothetical protein